MLRMNICVAGMQRCLWETDQEGKMAQYTDKSLRQQVIYQIFTRNYKGGKLKTYTNYYFRLVTRRKRNGVFCTVPMPSSTYYSGYFWFYRY